ncbi:MAG: MFS transporter [Spirochaetaceae bacterium]
MRVAGINYFFLFSAVAIVIPHLQLFFQAQGFSPSQVGVLLGTFELAGIAGPLFLGHAADRTGRYRASILLCIAAYAGVIAVMNALPLFLVVLPLAGLFGFFFKATVPLTDALASHLMEDPREQYGRVRMLGSIGFIATSLLVQVTGIIDGSSSTQILIAVLMVAAIYAAVVLTFPRVRRSDEAREKEEAPGEGARPAGDFWLFIVIVFIGRIGIAPYYSFFSIYLQQEVGITVVSGVWALGAIAEIPAIYFSGRLVRRLGVLRMITIAFLALILRLVIYAIAPVPAVVIPSQVLHALTFGFFHGASIAYINARVERSKRGLGMAIYNSSALGLSVFVGSSLGGVIIQELGFTSLFLIYCVPPAVSIVLLAIFRRQIKTPAAVAGVSWRSMLTRP